MKLRVACLLVGFLSVVQLSVAQTSAQTSVQTASALPRLVRFGGAVKDINGNPMTGVVGITFALYSEQTGGAPLWLETQNATADSNGHYTVLLGATKPEGLPAELFTSEQARWVGVQVSGQAEQPRVLLVSAPYALKAGDAETIGGLPPSAFVLAAPMAASSSASSSSTTDTVPPPTATDVTTTGGTADYLPIFSGAATIIDSAIFQSGSGAFAKVGIDTTTPATQLDVNGAGTIRGTLSLPSNGVATAAAGKPSQGLNLTASSFSSTSSVAVNQTFRFVAEPAANDTTAPSGTLNLQYGLGAATPTETGLKISSKGLFTFATGQTFPGAGTLTGITTAAGSGLSGGGTAGTLSLKVPAAGITNAMLADSKITLNNNTAGGLATPGAMTLGSTYTIGLKACAANQILEYSGTVWNCVAPTGTGTITGVTAGTDLTGGGTGGKVTLNLDTTKVPQLSAANVFTANQTVNGNLIVGIPTPTPLSILEASVSAPEALGPTLTLTNSTGGGLYGATSIDFNTYAPSTSGTYNPSSRIEAVGDGGYGDSLWFESNNDSSVASPNQGLTLNMVIGSNGRVNVGAQDPDPNDYAEQLKATSVWTQGNGEVSAVGAFGNPASNATDSNGSDGIYSVGGDAEGNAEADFGGDGGDFYGGFTPESSSGAAGYGIFATGGVGGVGVAADAAYFDGNITVTGSVFGAVNDLKIDHPLDPANKYLYHASVESSERMNIYTGNVVTDELGVATVKLPDWFEAENTDFRYQLTVIGRRAQAWVAEEVEHGQFKIASDATNTKISWQITAVRQDAFAKAHPLIVEQPKPARERGFYQNPGLFGQPAQRQTEWGRRPLQMERLKAERERQKLAARKRFTHSHDQPVRAVNKNQSSVGVAAQ